ncbi:MAG TPA: hypothetical protein DCR97_13320 [Deltaproteobacteria bacterium]|jgi:hypothetical protein|nr:hypothetical protein [Deltaproteobacteria bacterium]
MVESIVLEDGGKIKFYSHTYMGRARGNAWMPFVKWDNWDRQPHVDKFDGSGVMVGQEACNEKSLEDVLKLVQIFRKNLLSMELSKL